MEKVPGILTQSNTYKVKAPGKMVFGDNTGRLTLYLPKSILLCSATSSSTIPKCVFCFKHTLCHNIL